MRGSVVGDEHGDAAGGEVGDGGGGGQGLVAEYWTAQDRVFACFCGACGWCGACDWSADIVLAARVVGHEAAG